MLENNYDDSIPSMRFSAKAHGFEKSKEDLKAKYDTSAKAYGFKESKNSENFHGFSAKAHGFEKSKESKQIYPVLPSAPSDEGHTYRLQK